MHVSKSFTDSSYLLRNVTMTMARLLGTMKCPNVELEVGPALERLLGESGLLG